MSHGFKRSNSTDYILSKWIKEVQSKQDEYLKYLETMILYNDKTILEQILTHQQYHGKIITIEAMRNKEKLTEMIKQIEPELVTLHEFTLDYKSLVDEKSGLQLELQNSRALVELFTLDLVFIESIQLSLRNIIKAYSAVYIRSKKPTKKSEEILDGYVKPYTRTVKRLTRDIITSSNGFKSLINQLANEVEVAIKLEQDKQKQLEQEATTK
ncbi:MAG: hypothetical protein ACTSSH_06790 [Candidatus Heimdallarchaeota archaeon]